MAPEGSARQAAKTYQTRDIETADPIGRVLRVFEIACSHLARARAALGSGDPAAKGRHIHQVSRCLDLLQSSLDMENGAEVARDLDRLYSYLQHRLIEAHLHNDDGALGDIADSLEELASAWREVTKRPRSQHDRAAASVTP